MSQPKNKIANDFLLKHTTCTLNVNLLQRTSAEPLGLAHQTLIK